MLFLAFISIFVFYLKNLRADTRKKICVFVARIFLYCYICK